MDDLARPFSQRLCEHLREAPKQITTGRGGPDSFLEVCRKFNAGEVEEGRLLEVTAKLGFVNVVEAFQNLRGLEGQRFYSGTYRDGITVHESLHLLALGDQRENLEQEIEARWRLVESAWNLGVNQRLLNVQYDHDQELIFLLDDVHRRCDLSSVRPALNAYQRGHCFYCRGYISVDAVAVNGSEVDHFHPHRLARDGFQNVDGVWNLVLSCRNCNREKSDQLPHQDLVEDLLDRNEFFCGSLHPLRETIESQLGASPQARRSSLAARYRQAAVLMGMDTSRGWRPAERHELR